MILVILMTTNKNNETIINTSITKKCREYFWNVTIENTSKNEMLKSNKEDHHFDAPEFFQNVRFGLQASESTWLALKKSQWTVCHELKFEK